LSVLGWPLAVAVVGQQVTMLRRVVSALVR